MNVRILIAACCCSLALVGRVWSQEETGRGEAGSTKAARAASTAIETAAEAPLTIDPATLVPPPLAKKMSWEFTDLPLEQMLAEFSRRVEMPVLVDYVALDDIGLSGDSLVSDRLSDLPAYLLLERLSMSHQLGWFVDEGILIATTSEIAEDILTTQSHLVTDLRNAGYGLDPLIEVLQNATDGPWNDTHGLGGTISPVGDVLFVRQTEHMHREVAALLEALRHHGRATAVLDPAEHQRIRERLDAPASVSFDEMPLETAVQWLSEETQLHIHIDEAALTDVGVPIDEPLTLTLENKPLRTVLKYLLMPLELTATPYQGRLLVTTTEIAEEIFYTVVYDVSDICQGIDEDVLIDAIRNETEGPWEDVDGIGGLISTPVPGVLVLRQTESVHREVRGILDAYRRERSRSEPWMEAPPNLQKIETHYYQMHAATAEDLLAILPEMVAPGTWRHLEESSNGDSSEAVGEIRIVRTEPRTEQLPGESIFESSTGDRESSDSTSQPNVLVIPQAVLIIKHTKATHREIARFLEKVRRGDTHALGGGGIGGGFFCITEQMTGFRSGRRALFAPQ